jgi:hypothetical protein
MLIDNLELGDVGWLPDARRRNPGRPKLPPTLILGHFGLHEDQQSERHDACLRDIKKQKKRIRTRAARIEKANTERREMLVQRQLQRGKNIAARRREQEQIAKLAVKYKESAEKVKRSITQLQSWGRMVPKRRYFRRLQWDKKQNAEADGAASRLQAIVRQAAVQTIFKPIMKARLKKARRRIDANRNKPAFQTETLEQVHAMQMLVVPFLSDSRRVAKKTMSSFNAGNTGYYVVGKNELNMHTGAEQKEWSYHKMVAWRGKKFVSQEKPTEEELNGGEEVRGNQLPSGVKLMMDTAQTGISEIEAALRIPKAVAWMPSIASSGC